MAVLKAHDGTSYVDVSGVTDHGSLTGLDNPADHNWALLAASTFADNALIRGDGGDKDLQDSGVLLDDGNNMLFPTTAKVQLDNAEQYLQALTANIVRLNAVSGIALSINTNAEATVTANTLTFTQPINDVGLSWATAAELNILIDTVPQVAFADALVKPVLDDDVDFGTTSLRYKSWYSKAINPSHATNPSGVVADIWYNEATKTHRLKADDGIHNIVGAEALTTADDTVSNTTTETLFADTEDIAADSLVIGACYEWAAYGKLSGALDFIFRLKLDAVEVVTSGALTQNGLGGWFLKGSFTVRSIGASGTVQGNAEVGIKDLGSIPILTNGVATVDTTQILTVGVSVEMSIANVFNTATLQQFILKKVS